MNTILMNTNIFGYINRHRFEKTRSVYTFYICVCILKTNDPNNLQVDYSTYLSLGGLTFTITLIIRRENVKRFFGALSLLPFYDAKTFKALLMIIVACYSIGRCFFCLGDDLMLSISTLTPSPTTTTAIRQVGLIRATFAHLFVFSTLSSFSDVVV